MTSLGSGLVSADEPAFGDSGHVAISVERLFGYAHQWLSEDLGPTTSKVSSNTFSFLGGGAAAPYSSPRVGGDIFVARNFSIGFAGIVLHRSSTLTAPQGQSLDQSITLYQLAPRVGYTLRVSSRLTLWLRAGLAYDHNSTNSGAVTSTTSLTAVTVETPLVVPLAARAALLVAPFAEFGIDGSIAISSMPAAINTTATVIGVQLGLLVFL
ncbi:MAG TPA: hypothetical protein VNO55_25095 [Polyangia bacterium]|nr:hypothetical protein [Polyangia bacterium]